MSDELASKLDDVIGIVQRMADSLEKIETSISAIDRSTASMQDDISTSDSHLLPMKWDISSITESASSTNGYANSMLTRSAAKLLDFNIASRVGDRLQTQSGTPPYQAPDADLTRWDVTTDLFAVGVMLYELRCNGQHPYPGVQPMVDEDIIDPKSARPDLNGALGRRGWWRSVPRARADCAAAVAPPMSQPSPLRNGASSVSRLHGAVLAERVPAEGLRLEPRAAVRQRGRCGS